MTYDGINPVRPSPWPDPRRRTVFRREVRCSTRLCPRNTLLYRKRTIIALIIFGADALPVRSGRPGRKRAPSVHRVAQGCRPPDRGGPAAVAENDILSNSIVIHADRRV